MTHKRCTTSAEAAMFKRFPRWQSSRFTGNPFEISVTRAPVNSRSLFRQAVSHLTRGRQDAETNESYDALLSEAHRDFERLLRDVHTDLQVTEFDPRRIPPMRELLLRAVRCAAQQHILQTMLGNLALTDELTGLYNRRGFMTVADGQMKLGRRTGRGMLLFFVDVDGLKQINDSHGHSEGDSVLKRAAHVLTRTFRDSDVIARMGGDEFAILANEATGISEAAIRRRLNNYVEQVNHEDSRSRLSLSLGVVRLNPQNGVTIGQLVVQADQAMYYQKRRRLSSRTVAEES